MTAGNYGDRVQVDPTRTGARKTAGGDLWAVLHTSEGGETVDSAEQLAEFMTRPRTATNLASYHVVFDTDRIIPAVPYDTVAYSAGGGNARGRHGCFPGRAGQTRAEWLDTNSRAMIRQAAAWLVDCAADGIPLERLTPADVAAYRAGVCDHYDITRAFRKSTHTDVGPAFPWDVLWADVADIILEEDLDMPQHVYIMTPPAGRDPNGPWIYIADGSARYANNRDVANGVELWQADSIEQYDKQLASIGVKR